MTDVVNPVVNIIDVVINDVLRSAALKEAFALIVAAVPFLGWPVIGLATAFVINWLGGKVFDAIEKFASFKIIDMQVIEENANYQETVAQLKAAQATNDPAQIEAAAIVFKKTLGNLIHFDGS